MLSVVFLAHGRDAVVFAEGVLGCRGISGACAAAPPANSDAGGRLKVSERSWRGERKGVKQRVYGFNMLNFLHVMYPRILI